MYPLESEILGPDACPILDGRLGHWLNAGTRFLRPDMRIWDLPVECLCRNHLLAEHRELHAIWSIVVNDKRGYSRHPEVMRWRGCLVALWKRHEEQIGEMAKRGYSHRSPLNPHDVPRGHRGRVQEVMVDSIEEQRKKLRAKGCSCRMPKRR